MNGYIKIHRKIVEWEWYSNSNTKLVFLHLLFKASYKNTNWQGVEIKQGSLVTSLRSLAKELGLSQNQIRTALKNLIHSNDISIEATKKYSLITIVNWKLYQDKDTHALNHALNHAHSTPENAHQLSFLEDDKNKSTHQSTHQRTTYKESKNIKKKSNPPISPLKKKKDIFAITLPDELKLDKKIWDDFLEMRKQYPTTERAIELLLKKALRFQNEGHDVNKIFLTSIERGYRGIFEPTLPSTQKNKNYAHSTPKNEDLIGYDGKDNVEIKHI